MVVTLGLNISKRYLNILLTTLESRIGFPRLNEEFTMSHSLESKEKKFDFHTS